jgi:small-conductance mechanosensitive channel
MRPRLPPARPTSGRSVASIALEFSSAAFKINRLVFLITGPDEAAAPARGEPLIDSLLTNLPTLTYIDWPRVAIACTSAAIVLLVLWTARGLIARKYAQYAETERTERLEILFAAASRTSLPFMLVVSGYVGFRIFGTEDGTASLLQSVLSIALFWQAGLWVSTAVAQWLDHRRKVTIAEDKAAAGSIGIIRFVARALVWIMVVLLTLDNVGVDITALVAGLGIGGVAVALQNVLGDLLASLSIALDQPFVLGDFLVVGEHMGTVEYIGIKTTRLRSLTGEQIVMSNADLLSSRLRNYKRMYERRATFTIGVTYETPLDALRQVAPTLRSIVEAEDGVRFDRAHFAKYGPYSLDFDVVYYVLNPDFGRYMDVQQAINFRIHEKFDELGVEFAYPTQTVLLAGAGLGQKGPPAS